MESFWATFRLDPRLPRNAPLRASDADREVVRGVLVDAFADGRLTRDEYDERTARLFEARTLGELPAFVDDLVDPEDSPTEPPQTSALAAEAAARAGSATPAGNLARAEAAYHRQISGALGTFLLVGLITWAIWLSGGVHHPAWPLFPTAIFGVNLIKRVNRREETIDREFRRLQRRQVRVDKPERPEHPEDGE